MAGMTLEILWALILALLIGHLDIAEAGHAAWESSRVIRPKWVTISSPGMNSPQRWPGKFMRYCFADREAERRLYPYVRNGMNLWYAAGLPDNFKHEKVTLDYCKQHPETTLLIHYAAGRLDTPTGLYRHPSGTDQNRPTAWWDDDEDLGYYDATVNIAHELGHSWGLLHEQQNRLYHYNRHKNPYNVILFYCERMHNFAEMTQGLTVDEIWNYDTGVCRDAAAAANIGWGVSGWLPMQSGYYTYYSPHSSHPTVDDADWESIMLYPSYMGSVNLEEDGDISEAVLLKATSDPDDQYIHANLAPSHMDVEGLKILYGHRFPIPAPTLYGDPESPWNNAFKQVAPGCQMHISTWRTKTLRRVLL